MSHADGPWNGHPPTYTPRGVAATPHVLATAAGLDALRPGGSAVDGAIAANAAARGHARAIRIDHDSGFLEGGADPRGDGAAMGC